jgi:hypothetical protein
MEGINIPEILVPIHQSARYHIPVYTELCSLHGIISNGMKTRDLQLMVPKFHQNKIRWERIGNCHKSFNCKYCSVPMVLTFKNGNTSARISGLSILLKNEGHMTMPWINLYAQSTASEYIQTKTMIYCSPHTPSNGKPSHHFSYSENNNKICV